MKKSLFLFAALCCTTMGVVAGPKVTKTTREAPAQEPSENIEQKTQIIHVYMDTTYTYTTTSSKKEIPQEEDTTFTRKGHYLQGLIGAGYSSNGFKLEDLNKAKNNGGGNALIQFNYAYYFHENWGVMVGLEAEYMGNYTTLKGTKSWSNLGDTDIPTGSVASQDYEHIVTMNNWKEHQASWLIGLPVGIQMQYPIARMPKVTHRNNQLKLYADLGVKVNYLISNKYNLVSGSISHSGNYEKFGLTLDDRVKGHDFYTETIGDDFSKDKNKLDLNNISADGMIDLGVMIPVAEHLDVMVGLYANYTFNNLRKGDGKDLGWRQPEAKEEWQQHNFMETYDGVIASNSVKSVHPWDVGVKVGISWHKPAKKPKKFENYLVCDTAMQLTRREVIEEVPVAAKKINDIMKKSVIWFDFDSDKPKLQPADVIDKIAAVLLEHPEQLVLVYGHASKEGSMEYNQNLSERRAASIVRLLKRKGVPSEQMVSKGFSFTQQYDDSENPYHNIALDRRVEIIPVFEKDRIEE